MRQLPSWHVVSRWGGTAMQSVPCNDFFKRNCGNKSGRVRCVSVRLELLSGRKCVHAAWRPPVPRGLVHYPAEQLLLSASDSIDDVVRRGRQLRSASPWSVSCVGAQRY